MYKKIVNTLLVLSIILLLSGIACFGVIRYKEYKYQQRIKNAIIKVDLVENLNLEFNSDITISTLITSINGTLINDQKIDTTTLGEKEVKFQYINEENLKIPYKFKVNVIDQTPPVIWLGSEYSVKKGYTGNLAEAIMCGDNYDNNPTCEVIGEYDTDKVGNYPLVYKATDKSGNTTSKNFNLRVYQSSGSSSSNLKKVLFKDVVQKHKNENTMIGIDVSKWQGTIDYEKVKNAGVEFVFIRLGGTRGIDGEYYLDSKFKDNIEGFAKVGIPVGVYFYSYANSREKAKADALWVVEQLKNYEIELPIAYDWENWSSYNKFNLSFYNLTKNAEVFIDTINQAGYKGILYSSKSYLESIWLRGDYPVWLAHYTNETNYQGEYDYWQMTSLGKVDGITENTVDINIMYKATKNKISNIE